MTLPAYPAARIVAPKVYQHFLEHRESASAQGENNLAALPDEHVIETIVDVAFWTSLRREEQSPPRISLAFVAPDHDNPALHFESPLSLHPNALTRIAPGVERPGIHLGVWMIGGELKVWGATRFLPAMSFIVETVAPGLLVIKHHHSQIAAKFINVAVLEGDQVKILNREFSRVTACSSILGSLLGFSSDRMSSIDSTNIMIRLAVSMRDHRHGGSLLVVPRGSETWRSSVGRPLSYSVVPPYNELSQVMRQEPEEGQRRHWREAMLRGVEAVAGLTAIDGATVINEDSEVLAFGAKIIRPDGAAVLEQVSLMEPTLGAQPKIVETQQLGGTRHISAAQFAYVNRDSIAMVASQDGPFTIFAWADCDQTLYGYRVEALLL